MLYGYTLSVSLLDVIGPVMVGPSSSHTAGACRLALLARHMLLAAPEHAELKLHGSFAKTGKGHGSYAALAAGLLNCAPDDERIPQALDLAKAAGLELKFAAADLGDVHPNSVEITLTNADERVSMLGSSLGGGLVRIVQVGGFEAALTGQYVSLLLEHDDTPGVIARVARVLADDQVNIATLHSARKRRGGRALMSLEIDKRPEQYALDYLARLPYAHWLRVLPEVMGQQDGQPAEVDNV